MAGACGSAPLQARYYVMEIFMDYANQFVLLASKHHKEQVIEPILRQHIDCKLCVEDIDTDQFGTFTGEIPRPLSPYETCILKAKYAANKKNYTLSIASEGSFGPHRTNPFLPQAHEIMVFVDLNNDWVIAEQLLTIKTNYKMLTIHRDTVLDGFLESVHFPSHALTLQSGDRQHVIEKGIQDPRHLQAALATGFNTYDELLIATDMRAMMNPTRMQTLAELTEKLVIRIKTPCPGCSIPGFGFKSVTGNLPCSQCGDETRQYRFETWGCIQCDYQEHHPRKDQLITADPTHCDYCNP